MNTNRYFFAVASILLLGCQNADKSTSQVQKLKGQSNCLEVLPVSVRLDGGSSSIGSNIAYPEERPEQKVTLGSFEIEASEVTNKQFSTFVEETGYITDAEKPQPGFDAPGGAVFVLPTESEWEYAAKAGAETLYTWGDERAPYGKEKANTWQGAFPIQNTSADGFELRAPIGCFEPNAFGLYDMIGNVWEWTDTAWGDGQSQVIKGGSFLCAENFCRRYRASAKQA